MLSEELNLLIISLFYLDGFTLEQIHEHFNKQISIETIEYIISSSINDEYFDNCIMSFISVKL